MDCKSAQTALVKLLAGEPDRTSELELAKHIETCQRCARLGLLYGRVRDGVRALQVPDISPELDEAFNHTLAEARKTEKKPHAPPADPRPTAGFLQKALIFVLVMLGLGVVYVALVLLASRHYEPPPETGRITYRCGDLELCHPGISAVEKAPEHLRLTSDPILHTTENALIKVETDSATWWVDRSTALQFVEQDKVQFGGGRLMAECRGTAEKPIVLGTESGAVTCASGTFVARMLGVNLQVACLAGEASVSVRDGNLALKPGESALVILRTQVPPVRTVRPEWVTAWTKPFHTRRPDGVVADAAALLPLPSGPPQLPPGIRLTRLDVQLHMSGPVALATIAAELQSDGSEAWGGRLYPSELFWPAPVLAPPSGEIQVPAGQRAEVRCAALLSTCVVGRTHYLSVVPEAWSRRSVDSFSLALQGGAPGAVSSPTHVMECKQGGPTTTARLAEHDMPTQLPLLIRFDGKGKAEGALALPAEQGKPVLGIAGVQTGIAPSDDLQKAHKFILAFDAGGAYEEVGFAYALETAQEMCLRLKPGCQLRAAAYDGQLKVLQMQRPGPVTADQVLAGLWRLQEPTPRQEPGDLMLDWTTKLPCDKESATLLVTDHRMCLRDFTPKIGPQLNARTVVLQLGAQTPDWIYGPRASELGGAAMPIRGLSPEGAASLALSNMAWPGFTDLDISPANQTNVGRVLTPLGTPSNQPVVAVVRLRPEASKLDATFTLRAGGAQTQAVLSRSFAPSPQAKLDPALASALRDRLEEMLK